MDEKDKNMEEFDLSFHNMSLEDDSDDDLGCHSMTSTPEKNLLPGKHTLTPESKHQNEPISKRHQTSEILVADEDSDLVGQSKPSSLFHKTRRENYVKILQERFEVKTGSDVEQDSILAVLHLNSFQKAQATNAVKQAFPGSLVIRKRLNNDRVTFYKNIGFKSPLGSGREPDLTSTSTASLESYENQQLPCDSLPTSQDLNESAEIANLNKLIGATSSKLNSINKKLDDQLSENKIQADVVKTMLRMQLELQTRIQEYQNCITSLLQREVNHLVQQQSHCKTLGSQETKQLNQELETFIKYLKIDMESTSLSEKDFNGLFSTLAGNVQLNCPLIYNVLDTLLLHKSGGRDISDMRIKSAVHSLAILVSLKNQKIQNDFKLMFTFLCISFGAGCRFIGMLNHLGLTVSWEKAMNVFDKRCKKQQEEITQLTPSDVPVILLIDNINIYRGKRKHLRLFKSTGPIMWNFTGQAMLIPDIEGMEDILEDEEACISPQRSASKMKPEDIFLESDEERAKIMAKAVDRYLLDIIECATTMFPCTLKQLKEMTEQQFDSHLKSCALPTTSTSKYNINVPREEEVLSARAHNVKSNVHILPLSLEDNSTILGTMTILDKLTEQFNLPSKKCARYVPFDTISGKFDVISARSHFELLVSQKMHATNIQETVRQMHSREKTLNSITEDESDDETDTDDQEVSTIGVSTTLENVKRSFEVEDKPFWDAYTSLSQKLMNVIATKSDESYIVAVRNETNINTALARDHLQRSLLHVAVERNNGNFVKFLGLNVNDREGCGMTPLSIAVLQKNNALCKLLVESGSQYSGPLFTSLPSPLVMAKAMKLSEIQHIFEEDGALSDAEDTLIQEMDGTFIKNLVTSRTDQDSKQKCNRTCLGFITPVVGDVGTCKTNNAAMTRSASYRWVGLCPGDLHNKGYFCEAVFKVHGSSGFHCLLVEILKRKRLSKEVFKKKKFNDNNLVKVREAIRDACRSYGIAAVLEFTGSDKFPNEEDLSKASDVSQLLLTSFKEWLTAASDVDVAFRHRATAFLIYGPLLELYDAATAFGDGIAREAVYQAQLPIYAQLGFRSYFTEVFRHTVNFVCKWPKATRVLLQKNCCVNLLGKKGHGIELDAYVEAEVVQPFKKYVTGHTTVSMCELLMANLNMLKYLRKAYMSKEGFDVHHTSRHSVQSPIPDQLKGAWFCLQKGFFEIKNRQEVECYPLENNGCASGKVPKNLINVKEKGEQKIKDNFTEKLYDCFPDLRYTILLE